VSIFLSQEAFYEASRPKEKAGLGETLSELTVDKKLPSFKLSGAA